jgi:hypothetical protein
MTEMLTGGCHCGAVRYEAPLVPQRHSICCCRDCRRASGAPMVAWAVYAQGDIKLTKGSPKMRASSEHAQRYFCAACGTGLFYTSETYLPGLIDLQTATLDEPERIAPPTAVVQVGERVSWAADIHGLPEHRGYPGQG